MKKWWPEQESNAWLRELLRWYGRRKLRRELQQLHKEEGW